MAIEELVSTKDPRAVSALESFAKSTDASDDVRRQAAEVLWHLAGDFEIADSSANEALRGLAQSGDPSVQVIAGQALKDMEQYRQRQGR
jgi:HEAT repeat protein